MTPPVRPQLWRRPQSARPLQVVGFIATRLSDAERGPQIRMRPQEAVERMLTDGELVLVEGPRRQQLAELHREQLELYGRLLAGDGLPQRQAILFVDGPWLTELPSGGR